jgi:hypothetical protein
MCDLGQHNMPQRAPVDSIQIGNNSSPLASHAALYLVSFNNKHNNVELFND